MKTPFALLLALFSLVVQVQALNIDTLVLSSVGLCGDEDVDDLGKDPAEIATNTILPDWDSKKPFDSLLGLLIPGYGCVTDEKGHHRVRRLSEINAEKNLRGVKEN